MELRHIRYFLAVAESLNFTRAAARLGIAQPPLSLQIRDLEREVGTALFRRVRQGAELTEAGLAFLDKVRNIPEQTRESILAAQRASRGEIGSLRVGFTGSAVFNAIVPTTIRAYRRQYPGVELSLREGNSDFLSSALRDGTLDVAFLRPDAVRLDGLSVYLVDAEPMVAALPNALLPPVAPGPSIALSALADEPFILTPRHLGPTLVDAVLQACRDAGFTPILGQSAPQIAAVLALVAAEFGVSIVPASMRQAVVTGVRYLDVSDVRIVANLAIASRHGEGKLAVRNFLAQVVAPDVRGEDAGLAPHPTSVPDRASSSDPRIGAGDRRSR